MRYVLFLALAILLATQINHLKVDFGITPAKAIVTAAAFIIAINVCYSAAFDYIRNGTMTPKMSLTMAVVFGLTVFGSWISINSSIRAFAKEKHQMVINEEAGPVAFAYRNRIIEANNTLVGLSKAGVTSGVQYDNAMKQLNVAETAYTKATGGKAETSAYAKAITGGDDNSVLDVEVRKNSVIQALGLEGLCAAISILMGLGAPVRKRIEDTFGAMPKKRKEVSVPPAQNTVTPTAPAPAKLLDYGSQGAEESSVPPPNVTHKRSVSPVVTPAERKGQGSESRQIKQPVTHPSVIEARKVANAIKAGTYMDKRTNLPITETLSYRQLPGGTPTQRKIGSHLIKWGVMIPQGGNKPALISDAFKPITEA